MKSLQAAPSFFVSSKIIITLELIKCCLSVNTQRCSIWRHSQKITLQSCLSTFFSSADVLMLLSVQLIWRLTNLSNSLFVYLVEEHCFYLSLQVLSLLSLSGRPSGHSICWIIIGMPRKCIASFDGLPCRTNYDATKTSPTEKFTVYGFPRSDDQQKRWLAALPTQL